MTNIQASAWLYTERSFTILQTFED